MCKHCGNFGKYLNQNTNETKIKCPRYQYFNNMLKCYNKGDYLNRAVFCNNIFFLINELLLMMLIVYHNERQSKKIDFDADFFYYMGASIFVFYFGFSLILKWKPVGMKNLKEYSVFD